MAKFNKFASRIALVRDELPHLFSCPTHIQPTLERINKLIEEITGCGDGDLYEEQLERFETKLKKNAHLHVMIPTKILEEIRQKANEQDISMAEWCRRKLRGEDQLDRIEKKIGELEARR